MEDTHGDLDDAREEGKDDGVRWILQNRRSSGSVLGSQDRHDGGWTNCHVLTGTQNGVREAPHDWWIQAVLQIKREHWEY